MKDLWTDSPDYRRCYQREDDIDEVLAMLDLERARGLVDIGCGNGAFAVTAATRHPTCRVWAFDALESAVAECRARAGELVCTDVAPAHALPLPDAAVDRALMRSVLHHIADPDAVYREIARVLEPCGRVVLQAPCNYWEPAFGDVLSELMMMVDDSHRRYYYRPDEVVAGLEHAGFHVGPPECWTYSFPYLDDAQAELVRRNRAQERLQLQPIASGKWSIENYWVRVVATKSSEGDTR
jgi:SAM-dependent methyltransferase